MPLPPDLHIVDDPAEPVAELLADQARRGGSIVLTGGSSAGPPYQRAAALEPDWSKVTLWWGDDRCVPPEHQWSNYRLAKETLLDNLEQQPREVHRIRGELSPADAAAELDAALEGVELDLLLLGLGPDAHVASLFPGSPQLAVEDSRATSGPAGLEPWVDRVTMTMPEIRSAKRIGLHRRRSVESGGCGTGVRGRNLPGGARQPRAPGTNFGRGLPRSRRSSQTTKRMSAPEPQNLPRDVLEVERPEQLKALGHPLRLKVLQVLGESEKPLTNRELAASLSVDPGHLHFHVRMLHRAGLIELAAAAGREKPYRPVAKHFVVGQEVRATGLASDLQGAQLRELQRGFELFASAGEFRSAQLHAKLDIETVRELLNELVDKLTELEDESKPPLSITVAFHPLITQGETG